MTGLNFRELNITIFRRLLFWTEIRLHDINQYMVSFLLLLLMMNVLRVWTHFCVWPALLTVIFTRTYIWTLFDWVSHTKRFVHHGSFDHFDVWLFNLCLRLLWDLTTGWSMRLITGLFNDDFLAVIHHLILHGISIELVLMAFSILVHHVRHSH